MAENKNNGNNGKSELDSSKSLNNSSNSNQSNQSNNSDSLNSDGFNNPNDNENFGNDLQAQNKPINNGNSGKEGNGENKTLEDGFDGNGNNLDPQKLNNGSNGENGENSENGRSKDDAKNPDNSDNLADGLPEGAGEAGEAGENAKSGKTGAVISALKTPQNFNSSIQEAEAQDGEQNLKEATKETLEAAPKIAVDVVSGNVPGIVADAVNYASTTLPKLLKGLTAVFLAVLIFAASVFSMVGMLPSIIFGGLSEKLEERQINKTQKIIESYYEDRASSIVSDIIKQTKAEAEIGTFSAWKRVVAGKNENYSVTVQRANEADALITVNNKKDSTGLLITVKNVYLTDYTPLRVDKVALVNSYSYEDAYKDEKCYKDGQPVDINELFNTDETKRWRGKDTAGLKKWLDDNANNLVTYSVEEGNAVVKDGITYRQMTYVVDGIFTDKQIYAAHGFTDAQIEQLDALNFAGNMYIDACNDTTPDGTEELGFNIYPKLDVYTNLVGGNDNLIWSMLPKDYKHLIADNDETGTASLIREYLTTVKKQVGYVADENNSTPYGKWNNTDGTNWNVTMLAWCANEVDNTLSMDTKLLGEVIPNTNDVDYMTGYLFNNNYVWHYKADNYVPQAGDFVVLYEPQQTIDENGEVTVTDKAPISETYPDFNITDTELRTTALGVVLSSSGGTVTFVCGDTANHSVEQITYEMASEKIVAYVTPSYDKVVGEDGVLNYEGEVLDKGYFLFPVKGTVTVSALYPLYPSGAPHSGVDFACPINSPVVAANSGTVVKVDNQCKTTYGKFIKIESDTPSGKVYCIYAHLNQICVKEGDTVSAGNVIALSGNTGNSTGPHLHFGVKNSFGVNVNPIGYLARRSEIKLHERITN